MKNFIVLYSPFNCTLFDDYEQIQGKTAIDAARKFLGPGYTDVKRSGDRDVGLCLLEGTYNQETMTLARTGNAKKQWYKCKVL